MVADQRLLEIIEENARINVKMLERLDNIRDFTKDTAHNLRKMERNLSGVIMKYKHFSDLMYINMTLLAGSLFCLIGIAIKI